MNITITGKIDKQYNRKWPPIIDSIILIDHPNITNNLSLGFIYKYMWNNSACIVILMNNLNYVENKLIQHNIVDTPLAAHGTMILLPIFGWKYVNLGKLSSEIQIPEKKMGDIVLQRKTEFESKTILNDYPITRLDLINYGIYEKRKKKEEDVQCNMDDGVRDESLLTKTGELQMDHLFTEKHIKLFDPQEQFVPLNNEIKLYLKQKLRLVEKVKENEMRIIVNKSVAVRNIIDTKEDEINEGNKIISWLMQNMVQTKTDGIKIFGGLKFAIHNGYIHIGRKGINVQDIVTDNLVGKLAYFQWQYDIPIDYDSLKYILFQNKFQKSLSRDNKQRIEVEKILSQEYLLLMQPQPKYVMFALKRLIMAWHCDDLLTLHIRKIKILINQWRAKPDEKFNNQYGILPMIVIYPRYGKDSARICLTKIADYFLLYTNIAWDCSIPSYSIKISDLIYYTNGHLDLKLYFRKTVEAYNGTVKNNSFEEDLKKIIGAENMLYNE